MTPPPETLEPRFEPRAESECTDAGSALASIAISLRRIADAMTSPVNAYGEAFHEAIVGSLVRAAQSGQLRP